MTTDAVQSASGAAYPSFVGDMPGVSPDALLEYCQIQMGGLDNQITDQMNVQNKLLQERGAIEHVQSVVEGYGTQGPTDSGPGMDQCVQAYQSAIDALPKGDPVAGQLAAQLVTLKDKYGYVAGGGPDPNNVGDDNATMGPSATNPKTDEWKGTTDALTNLAQDVKGNADIDMLKLQDLVSQRQQAMQLCSGIMSKVDATLENQAKAIGQ